MREKIMADFRKEIGILQSNMVFKDEYEEQKVEIQRAISTISVFKYKMELQE